MTEERKRGNDMPVDQYFCSGGYFRQQTVDSGNALRGTITARVLAEGEGYYPSGEWRNFTIVTMDADFVQWNLGERITRIERMLAGEMTAFGGAHNPSVASYGNSPSRDAWNRSRFSLNNAVKGMGLAPCRDEIDGIIGGLHDRWDVSAEDRLRYLRKLYGRGELWDMSKQISLELYLTPERLTHSFLNWMENPLAAISFMALDFQSNTESPRLPTYELRSIVKMLHPCDPALDSGGYEFKLMTFANTVHDFFHHTEGQRVPRREEMHAGVIHYICEEFDNYWGPAGRSRRVV